MNEDVTYTDNDSDETPVTHPPNDSAWAVEPADYDGQRLRLAYGCIIAAVAVLFSWLMRA